MNEEKKIKNTTRLDRDRVRINLKMKANDRSTKHEKIARFCRVIIVVSCTTLAMRCVRLCTIEKLINQVLFAGGAVRCDGAARRFDIDFDYDL